MFTVFQKNMNNSLLLGVLLSILLNLPAYASVPIEQRSLSNAGAAAQAAPAENSQGSTLWQLYQQVQQLQQEVRDLRGQLEDQQDTIARTQKELKNRYADLDQRVELLNQAQNQESTPETTDGSENNANPGGEPSTKADEPEKALPAPTPTPTPTPTPENGSPVAEKSNAVADTLGYAKAGPKRDNRPAPTAAEPANAEKNAYVSAYDAYKNGGAAKAIRPMQGFIATYPNSVYVPNAHYWLGEFYLASDPVDFVKAKQSFLLVVSKYPKSAKASTSLYRLATITKEIDRRPQEALTLMRKVIQDYPSSQEASFAKSFINSN